MAITTPERGAVGLGALLVRLLGEARQLFADYSLLAVLDARRAAMQLAWLLSCGLVVAVLTVTAWLALVVAVMVWIAESVLSWPAALAIAAGANVAMAVALLWWMRHLLVEKPFEALLRQLKGGDADAPGSRD